MSKVMKNSAMGGAAVVGAVALAVAMGWITLPSGLMYKVLQEGTGLVSPTANTPCACHYHGTLINGDVFDSSVQRGSPTTFAPNQVRAQASWVPMVDSFHDHE